MKEDMFYDLVSLERKRQEKAWPNTDRQYEITPEKWSCIIGEEFGEFLREVNDKEDFKALIELAETVACCYKMVHFYPNFTDEMLERAFLFMKDRTTHQKSKEKSDTYSFVNDKPIKNEEK